MKNRISAKIARSLSRCDLVISGWRDRSRIYPHVGVKMRFHGIHRAELFGVPPSGRHVWWIGMPIFTFAGGKVRDFYVLGDIHGLIPRLKGEVADALPATFT